MNNAVSTLKKRVRKVKSMKITKKRGNETINDEYVDKDLTLELGFVDFEIVKRKSIKLECVSEEEALLNLEALNHSFYLFKNKDKSGRISLIYRRNDSYGIIEVN